METHWLWTSGGPRAALTWLMACAERSGHRPVVVWPAPQAVFVSDPVGIRDVLSRSEDFAKDPAYAFTVPLLGRGLVTSSGALWRRQRALIGPQLRPANWPEADRVVQSAVEASLDRIRATTRLNRAVDVLPEMTRFSRDIVLAALVPEPEQVSASTVAHFEALRDLLDKQLPLAFLPRALRPGAKAFSRRLAALDAAVFELIDGLHSDARASALLPRLASAGVDRRQLRDEFVTLLQAGHETVALGLTWLICLLSAHPDAWAQLRSSAENAPKPEHRVLLGSAVFEALRLYPPAWIFVRRSQNTSEVQGVSIPAGTRVLMSPWVTHRDPRFWKDPLAFRVDRFVGGRRNPAFFPFLAGPRTCPGEALAMRETTALLHALLTHFDLETTKGRLEPKFVGNLMPGERVWRRFRLQDHQASREASAAAVAVS